MDYIRISQKLNKDQEENPELIHENAHVINEDNALLKLDELRHDHSSSTTSEYIYLGEDDVLSFELNRYIKPNVEDKVMEAVETHEKMHTHSELHSIAPVAWIIIAGN